VRLRYAVAGFPSLGSYILGINVTGDMATAGSSSICSEMMGLHEIRPNEKESRVKLASPMENQNQSKDETSQTVQEARAGVFESIDALAEDKTWLVSAELLSAPCTRRHCKARNIHTR
jgi:hypothetical protein